MPVSPWSKWCKLGSPNWSTSLVVDDVVCANPSPYSINRLAMPDSTNWRKSCLELGPPPLRGSTKWVVTHLSCLVVLARSSNKVTTSPHLTPDESKTGCPGKSISWCTNARNSMVKRSCKFDGNHPWKMLFPSCLNVHAMALSSTLVCEYRSCRIKCMYNWLRNNLMGVAGFGPFGRYSNCQCESSMCW